MTNKQKHWWFGVNSTWAKFCRWIGREEWIYKKPTHIVYCCPRWGAVPETARRATAACERDYSILYSIEFDEGVFPPDCPLEHVKLTERPVCPDTGFKRNPWCPDPVKQLMSDEEWETLATCIFHKKPDPHPPIPSPKKVSTTLRVPNIVKKIGYPVFVSATFVPGFTCFHKTVLDRPAWNKEILDFLCEENIDNTDRFFLLGQWEPHTLKMVSSPFKKTSAGKFDLMEWNNNHFDKVKQDIAERAKRFRFTIVTLIDNCSTHVNVPGFWSAHPFNGNNNVNGTSTWKPSIYHFYEPEWQDTPGIPETWRHMERYIRKAIKELYAEFHPYVGFEICNEGQGAHGLHELIRGWIQEEGVKSNWRILTSIDWIFRNFYKKQMDFLNYSIHGINSWEDYDERKPLVTSGRRFLASGDGTKPQYGAVGYYDELVYRILKDGSLGFELNERPYWYGNNFDPKVLNKDVMRQVGKGFKKWAQEAL